MDNNSSNFYDGKGFDYLLGVLEIMFMFKPESIYAARHIFAVLWEWYLKE